MSFFITAVLKGFGSEFFGEWMRAFITAWVIAFPVATFVVPIVRKSVHKLVKSD
jgi:hypothetical protein